MSKQMPVALIIDDEPDLLQLLSITLKRKGIRAVSAGDVRTAKQKLDNEEFDLCLTDLRLPDGSGIDIVEHIQRLRRETPVAVLTAYGDPGSAVAALKAGAFDYVSKPVHVEQLNGLIETALQLTQGGAVDSDKTTTGANFLGESQIIEQIRVMVRKVARNQAPVFISGETGTGKEMIARLIHESGPRNSQSFVAVNCGAIPRELMESEFFGHKKGSFTGAYNDKQGLFEAANGGTLFLDEIAELPLELQVKLLRTIQEKTVRPVGEVSERNIDVRLISATHKDLLEMVDNGRFRQDLYYRLNVIPMTAPPLRQRKEDIPILVAHFIKRLSSSLGVAEPDITSSALRALSHYDYPGNVRELENIIERTLALFEGNHIAVEDVLLPRAVQAEEKMTGLDGLNGRSIEEFLETIEASLIGEALAETNGNITEAAKVLGTTFRSLRYKIKKLNINDDHDE